MKREAIVLNNLGIIGERALYHWSFLPASTKAYYTREDMIQDCVLHCCRVVKKYKKAKAKTSTFIWWAAHNHCLTLRQAAATQKRGAGLSFPILTDPAAVDPESKQLIPFNAEKEVALDQVEDVAVAAPSAESFLSAASKMEILIAQASVSCRDFIEACLMGKAHTWKREPTKEEMQFLVRRLGITLSDFKTVQMGLCQ